MRAADTEEFELFELQFKNQIFANNPELYREMFGAENELGINEADVQWEMPKTEGDFDRMKAELSALGIPLL